jgi:hypothetical protein
MMELLDSGLRNNAESETFKLKTITNGSLFPLQYIKIVPLMAWGNDGNDNFHFSIWHVGLKGVTDASYMEGVMREFHVLQEREAVRLCLKHFRQRNYVDSFDQLRKRTKIDLEAPALTRLHTALVVEGNFIESERLILECGEQGHMEEYISTLPCTSKWEFIGQADPAAGAASHKSFPQARGGHQMCVDEKSRVAYLFGGWQGKVDLNDFWGFHMDENRWELLSSDTREQGGPSPRSCHNICINDHLGHIYVLGRYVDGEESTSGEVLTGDFYRYNIAARTWTLISANTAADGGPPLVNDPEMCMNTKENKLYVLGGKVNGVDTSAGSGVEGSYGGLYMHDCNTNVWKLLRDDRIEGSDCVKLRSRHGHSMVYSDKENALYFFAGKRQKDYLSDFFKYCLDTSELVEVSRDSSKQGGPLAGFSQRAAFDQIHSDLYVLYGLVSAVPVGVKKKTTANDSLWVYNTIRESWYCAYTQCEQQSTGTDCAPNEPCVRYAHQFVYDSVKKVHYLFGGKLVDRDQRLGDFWRLKLERYPARKLITTCQYMLRRQRFTEMCGEDSRGALRYLQSDLHSVVNHTDPVESADFRSLTASLFKGGAVPATDDFHSSRMDLYEKLLEYFPTSLKQPQGNLLDLLKF